MKLLEKFRGYMSRVEPFPNEFHRLVDKNFQILFLLHKDMYVTRIMNSKVNDEINEITKSLLFFQDSKIVDAEKYKELLDTNETLKKEITKLEKAKSETERLVSIMFETDETLKKEITKLEKAKSETERLVSIMFEHQTWES